MAEPTTATKRARASVIVEEIIADGGGMMSLQMSPKSASKISKIWA